MIRMPRKPELYTRELGVTVRQGWVPEGSWGTYDARLHLITLRRGLGPLQLLCTLMHELGHAAHMHKETTPRNERQANHWAALRLISRRDFEDAIVLNRDRLAVAHRLGVMPDVVDHYVEAISEREREYLDALVRESHVA